MPELPRLDDWRARLSAEMDRQRREPFAWYSHDCFRGFASGIVSAITGQDVAEDLPEYRTEAEAAVVLKGYDVETLGDFLALRLPETHPAFAQVGDLGVVSADGMITQAICMFDVSGLVVMTAEGHGRRPRGDAIRAFKVGE